MAGSLGEATLGEGMLGAGGTSVLDASAALGADCCKSAWLNVIVAKFPSLLIVTFVAPTLAQAQTSLRSASALLGIAM